MSICFIRLGHHDQPIFRYLFGQFSQMVAKYSDVYKIRLNSKINRELFLNVLLHTTNI